MTLLEYLRDKNNPTEASARVCLLMNLAAEEIERLNAELGRAKEERQSRLQYADPGALNRGLCMSPPKKAE
jgi:hypothetical protein